MSTQDKLNSLIHKLLIDTQNNRLRWQCVSEDVMRTVEPIPKHIEPMRRRYIYLKECGEYIRVSVSEPYKVEAFWGHIVPTADATALYEEALEQQREINRMLDEIIEDLEGDDKKTDEKISYESPHWILNGLFGENIKRAGRSIGDFFGLFKKERKHG